MRFTAAVFLALSLASCASPAPLPTAPPPPASVSLKAVCSTVKVYTAAQTQALAAAIAPLAADNILVVAIADLARMRAEARACQKAG